MIKLSLKRRTEKGYTLLFAVLTATLVLGVAVFITSASRQQFELSETARNSTFSIYNADSGMECGAAAFSANALTATGGTIYCGGSSYTYSKFTQTNNFAFLQHTQGYPETSSEKAPFNFGANGCVLISFTTGYDSNNNPVTIIDSYGYNACSPVNGVLGPAPGTRTVERALELTYD